MIRLKAQTETPSNASEERNLILKGTMIDRHDLKHKRGAGKKSFSVFLAMIF